MKDNDILGKEPAFANVAFDESSQFTHCEEDGHYGMTKRFYAACAAMQGLIINGQYPHSKEAREVLIEDAYLVADELLRQENQQP